MPIYDFEHCGKTIEVIMGMDERKKGSPPCESCGKPMKALISGVPALRGDTWRDNKDRIFHEGKVIARGNW